MMPCSRRTIAATTESCADSGSVPTSAARLETALVEDRLRGGDAQLLGHEGDRKGQEGVEVEEPFGGRVARGGKHADGEGEEDRAALGDAQEDPEGAA